MSINSKINQFLSNLGIKETEIRYGLSSDELQKICIEKGLGKLSDSGALAVNTGEFTGRSPKDRFIVKDSITKNKVWWGDINISFDENKFEKLYQKVVKHVSNKELFVRDAYACSDSRFRTSIRIITELPWVNIFSINMFLRPKKSDLESFEPEWVVIHAPSFMAIPLKDGTRKHTFSIINFKKKTILIGGSGYTGEVKKGIFSVLNFILPDSKEALPMHCSANVGENGETAIFFGLSGTGKTTLSADSNRKLIGDDEHGWSKDNVIFNFEGGCYAKVINIKEENEPDIFNAIKKGALLENVIFKNQKSKVDYSDTSITQNTRVSYPINFIKNIKKPSVGKNPKNLFFFNCRCLWSIASDFSSLTKSSSLSFHFWIHSKSSGNRGWCYRACPFFFSMFWRSIYASAPNSLCKDVECKNERSRNCTKEKAKVQAEKDALAKSKAAEEAMIAKEKAEK